VLLLKKKGTKTEKRKEAERKGKKRKEKDDRKTREWEKGHAQFWAPQDQIPNVPLDDEANVASTSCSVFNTHSHIHGGP